MTGDSYYLARAALVLAGVHADPGADPAPLAQAARAAGRDMTAGAVVGPDGTVHARTVRDGRGTYRVHEAGAQWAADMWAARHARQIGRTVHVPLWRVFTGPAPRVQPAPAVKQLSDAECAHELEAALADVEALVRVLEPRNAFMDALGRLETWRRFLTLPHAVP